MGNNLLKLVDLVRQYNGRLTFHTVGGFFEIEYRIPVPGRTDGAQWAERMTFEPGRFEIIKTPEVYLDIQAGYMLQRVVNALNQHRALAAEGV